MATRTFTVFHASRHFGWISPRQVNLRKVAVITVSKLVTGADMQVQGQYAAVPVVARQYLLLLEERSWQHTAR
jgi:hypothetical protein